MCPDFLVISECYYLQYIKEPNKFLYFIDIIDCKLYCTESRLSCSHLNHNDALAFQGRIKDLFGLEFQIVKEVM